MLATTLRVLLALLRVGVTTVASAVLGLLRVESCPRQDLLHWESFMFFAPTALGFGLCAVAAWNLFIHRS